MTNQLPHILIFLLVLGYVVFTHGRKAPAMWVGVAVMVALGAIAVQEIPWLIHWNILGVFGGTLVLAMLFIESKVPVLLSDLVLSRSRRVSAAFLRICILTSFLSIFIENIATVLIVAPVALETCRRLRVSPVPLLIGLAISSNLQGTGTLIGDPPSMLLAAAMHMDFNDFFWLEGRPGIFFAVQAGAVPSLVVLYLFFARYRQPVPEIPPEPVRSWVPTWVLGVMLVGLALSPLADPDFRWLAGSWCVALALVTLVWAQGKDGGALRRTARDYDWDTTAFLGGLFVMVAVMERVGVITGIRDGVVSMTGDSLVVNYMVVVWLSVLFSSVIDNVPYVATMIPVVQEIGVTLGGTPYLLPFGLLMGACLGGNISPVGAAANIVSVGMLRKEGHRVSAWDFVKIGLPFTVSATAAGALFVWMVWR